MKKYFHTTLVFISLISVLMLSTATAAEREYVVPMEKAQWQSSGKTNYQCGLSQTIPFYGKGIFIHKSGHKVKFNLLSDEPVMDDNVKIILRSETPPWRHDDNTVFEIGQFVFERGHNPLVVPSPFASRMLQQVENGMSPVVIYRDMADGRDIIAVMLSPVNFRKALADYRHCEKSLMDFDMDEIKNLKLYFATNKDILTARSKRDLKNILIYLKLDPTIKQIKIDAHADSRGRRRFNDKLAQRRSAAVKKYLLSVGAKPDMVYAVSHGERKPTYTNKTAQGRSKNRRADVQLLTTPAPTAEQQKAIAEARKAERRRELTERSIFNRTNTIDKPPLKKDNSGKKPVKKQLKNNISAPAENKAPDVQVSAPAPQAEDDYIDIEPPAPNFINFDHLVDKNNQKFKSK